MPVKGGDLPDCAICKCETSSYVHMSHLRLGTELCVSGRNF